MTDEARVTTQSFQRPRYGGGYKPEKWAYVIHWPGHWPHVSAYRYGSEETARAAGERDLEGLRDFYAQNPSAV